MFTIIVVITALWMMQTTSRSSAETCFKSKSFIVTTEDIKNGNLADIEEYIAQQTGGGDRVSLSTATDSTFTQRVSATLSTTTTAPTTATQSLATRNFNSEEHLEIVTPASCSDGSHGNNSRTIKNISINYHWIDGGAFYWVVALSPLKAITYNEAEVVCRGVRASVAHSPSDDQTLKEIERVLSKDARNSVKAWAKNPVHNSRNVECGRAENVKAVICSSGTGPVGRSKDAIQNSAYFCNATLMVRSCIKEAEKRNYWGYLKASVNVSQDNSFAETRNQYPDNAGVFKLPGSDSTSNDNWQCTWELGCHNDICNATMNLSCSSNLTTSHDKDQRCPSKTFNDCAFIRNITYSHDIGVEKINVAYSMTVSHKPLHEPVQP